MTSPSTHRLTVPHTAKSPVIRCDFSDGAVWARTWKDIVKATEDGFQKNVEKVENRTFDGLEAHAFLEMTRRLPDSYPHAVLFFADSITMSGLENTLLVTWAWKDEYEGQFFRCLPSDVLAIENNVCDNMPWEEFYEHVGEDGVCRIE
jgi:hypothetical protein